MRRRVTERPGTWKMVADAGLSVGKLPQLRQESQADLLPGHAGG